MTPLETQLAQCVADGQRMAKHLEEVEARAERAEARVQLALREAHTLALNWQSLRDEMRAAHSRAIAKLERERDMCRDDAAIVVGTLLDQGENP